MDHVNHFIVTMVVHAFWRGDTGKAIHAHTCWAFQVEPQGLTEV